MRRVLSIPAHRPRFLAASSARCSCGALRNESARRPHAPAGQGRSRNVLKCTEITQTSLAKNTEGMRKARRTVVVNRVADAEDGDNERNDGLARRVRAVEVAALDAAYARRRYALGQLRVEVNEGSEACAGAARLFVRSFVHSLSIRPSAFHVPHHGGMLAVRFRSASCHGVSFRSGFISYRSHSIPFRWTSSFSYQKKAIFEQGKTSAKFQGGRQTISRCLRRGGAWRFWEGQGPRAGGG